MKKSFCLFCIYSIILASCKNTGEIRETSDEAIGKDSVATCDSVKQKEVAITKLNPFTDEHIMFEGVELGKYSMKEFAQKLSGKNVKVNDVLIGDDAEWRMDCAIIEAEMCGQEVTIEALAARDLDIVTAVQVLPINPSSDNPWIMEYAKNIYGKLNEEGYKKIKQGSIMAQDGIFIVQDYTYHDDNEDY